LDNFNWEEIAHAYNHGKPVILVTERAHRLISLTPDMKMRDIFNLVNKMVPGIKMMIFNLDHPFLINVEDHKYAVMLDKATGKFSIRTPIYGNSWFSYPEESREFGPEYVEESLKFDPEPSIGENNIFDLLVKKDVI
jgi:hypothetical protein